MAVDRVLLTQLRDRLLECNEPDWRLDDEILNCIGQVRRVSRLTLNGRSPGSYRYFGPKAKPGGVGSPVPKPTKDPATCAQWARKLTRMLEAHEK